MKLTDKNITLFALTCFIIISTTWLFLNPIQPKEKQIAEIKEGDFVIIKAHIQDMKVISDIYRNISDISRIVLIDGTGNLDVVAFGDTRKKLLNYILSYNPMIKTGDYVEVKGRISIYQGKYQLILNDIGDFKLIEKRNFERDVYLSPTPTNIYASPHGKKYHTSKNCPYGKRLKTESIIYFYSEDDAKALGYEKCKWCEKHDD